MLPESYADGLTLEADALGFAAEGRRVLPVHSIRNGKCSCGSDCPKPGKHPRVLRWQKVATTDPAQIREWWRRWPDANVGVAMGDGVFAVDVDGDVGAATLIELCERHGGLPATRCVGTGRGWHFYFRTAA